MTDDLTSEYENIFMTIEKNVVDTCRKYSDLVDHNIDKVYEAVQRTLEKELQGKNPPTYRWKGHEEELFYTVDALVHLFLGDEALEITDADSEIEVETVSKETMVKILKRLRSSVKTWTGSSAYGRRGYIDYISRFL